MGFPFDYTLGPEALEVRCGPWIVRKVRYADIEDVRLGWTFWNEHWTNIWPWKYLNVRLRRSFLPNFLISPPDRERFAEQLRSRLGGVQKL